MLISRNAEDMYDQSSVGKTWLQGTTSSSQDFMRIALWPD